MKIRSALLLAALALVAAACGGAEDASTSEPAAAPAETQTEAAAPADSASICDTEGLVQAVESGAEEGTLAGMADDPVATAASSNPVLTTLVAAVSEAGLVDTLNSAEALTVFAPTDCAFAALDPETLDAAMADPDGLLTQVLGFHVIAGERLSAADLAGETELETFTGEMLSISAEGDSVRVGGQAEVLVPDIQTANATVHLIDTVMMPGEGGMGTPSTEQSAAPADSASICDTEGLVAAVESGSQEGTLAGMADDPVATAASNNPVLTTLVAAVGEAGLGDTLNSAEALTVFAPTDCAFAALDPETMEAAMADPTGLLTQVLGFHVVAGQRLSAADLAGMTELETFTGETLSIASEGDNLRVGGQATVLVPDIQTANATVHLIDTVMMPQG